MSSVIGPPGMQDQPDAKQLLEMLAKGVSIPIVGSIDESTWMDTGKLWHKTSGSRVLTKRITSGCSNTSVDVYARPVRSRNTSLCDQEGH